MNYLNLRQYSSVTSGEELSQDFKIDLSESLSDEAVIHRDLDPNKSIEDPYPFRDVKKKEGEADTMLRQHKSTELRTMNQITGRIIEIDESKAYIEFEKNGSRQLRSISISALRQHTSAIIQPGDVVRIISVDFGLSRISTLEYLGHVEFKMDSAEMKEIEEKFKRAKKDK